MGKTLPREQVDLYPWKAWLSTCSGYIKPATWLRLYFSHGYGWTDDLIPSIIQRLSESFIKGLLEQLTMRNEFYMFMYM